MGPTEAFGADAAALQRVEGPVVVLEGVHQLQDGAHPADGAVDGGGADELRGQVGVEGQLHLRHVFRQTGHTGARFWSLTPPADPPTCSLPSCFLINITALIRVTLC